MAGGGGGGGRGAPFYLRRDINLPTSPCQTHLCRDSLWKSRCERHRRPGCDADLFKPSHTFKPKLDCHHGKRPTCSRRIKKRKLLRRRFADRSASTAEKLRYIQGPNAHTQTHTHELWSSCSAPTGPDSNQEEK